MTKKLLVVLFLIFGMFSFMLTVDAATCDNLADLKAEANLVEINYELVKTETSDLGDVDESIYFYDILITNVTDDLEVHDGINEYTSKDAVNGVIKFRVVLGGRTHRFEIYGSRKTGCNDRKLRTISVKLPRYNRFSEFEECIGHTADYPICATDANAEKYDDDEFRAIVAQQAKEFEEKQQKKQEKKKETTKKKNIFELYVDNAGITVPITILVIAAIGGYVYKVVSEDKKKAKIDLGVKKNAKKHK